MPLAAILHDDQPSPILRDLRVHLGKSLLDDVFQRIYLSALIYSKCIALHLTIGQRA